MAIAHCRRHGRRAESIIDMVLHDQAMDLEALAQEPEDEEVEGRDDDREEDHDGDARDRVAQVVAADALPGRLDQDAEVGLQEPARGGRWEVRSPDSSRGSCARLCKRSHDHSIHRCGAEGCNWYLAYPARHGMTVACAHMCTWPADIYTAR